MDKAREKVVRDLASSSTAPPCVVRFAISRDSDDASCDSSAASDSDNSPSTPSPTALHQRGFWRGPTPTCRQLRRTSASLSAPSALSPAATRRATSAW
ncbi:unnamed protein product [Pylaiella littoralis]